MAKSYKKPPIVEATCDLRFITETPWNLIPGLLFGKIKDEFPIIEQTSTIEISLDVTGKPAALPPQPATRFFTQDKSELIQVAPNQISIHQLRPYQGWKHFRARIQGVLGYYLEFAEVLKLARVGLRYIDRVELPNNNIALDFDDYFLVMPHVPSAIPQTFARFLAQAEVPYEDPLALMRITFGTAVPEGENRFACVLDIDLSSGGDAVPEMSAIDEWLEVAHTRVEEAFYAAFTTKTHKDIFEEETE